MRIPASLAESCRGSDDRMAWLASLPRRLDDVARTWHVRVGEPFDGLDVSASWVAPCERADGTSAVVKLGMPHLEGEHEIAGLRFWDGDPTVRLLEADEAQNAMLLERCEPGTTLRSLPETEQDRVIADALHALWRDPPEGSPFRPLATMIHAWIDETLEDEASWVDPGLIRSGLEMFDDLLRTSEEDVVLATDLHAGNVLRSQRRPWLVIDPKPFVGERAYDVTQHLINCEARMSQAPLETVKAVADVVGVDDARARRWMFARVAGEPRPGADVDWSWVARRLAE